MKLIAPQFVKPYVKSNKNDANDAEAICEAMSRPSMRFVAVKTVEQQDIQAVHRVRASLIERAHGEGEPDTRPGLRVRTGGTPGAQLHCGVPCRLAGGCDERAECALQSAAGRRCTATCSASTSAYRTRSGDRSDRAGERGRRRLEQLRGVGPLTAISAGGDGRRRPAVREWPTDGGSARTDPATNTARVARRGCSGSASAATNTSTLLIHGARSALARRQARPIGSVAG